MWSMQRRWNCFVADGDDFVDEQDFGVDVDRHGEPESHVHADE